VSAAFNYDIYSNLPTSKVQVSNMQYAVSGPPNQSIMIPLECNPASNVSRVLHIDQGQSGLDRHWYDFARLDIVTQGSQADYDGAMEIWVTYDMELIKPDLDPGSSSLDDVPSYHLSLGDDAKTPFAPAAYEVKQPEFNNMGAVQTDTTLSFDPDIPMGWYCFQQGIVGGTVGSILAAIITYSGGFVDHQTIGGVDYKPIDRSFANTYQAPNATVAGLSLLNTTTYMYYDGSGTASVPPRLTSATDGTWPSTAQGDFVVSYLNPGFISNRLL